MRLIYMLAVLTVIMGFAALSSAEIYRYRDAGGVLRFTDNPAEIPESQLPESLKTYKKIEEFSPPEAEITPQPKTASPEASPKAAENVVTEETAPSDALIEQRRGLSSEHAEIKTLTQKLDSQKVSVKTPAERNEYNESVRLLNERISAYEKKRKVFEENLNAFNEELNRKPVSPEAANGAANGEAGKQAQENDIPLTVSEPEKEEESAAPAEGEEAASGKKAAKTPAATEDAGAAAATASSASDKKAAKTPAAAEDAEAEEEAPSFADDETEAESNADNKAEE
ncbi:MAG: hypothetical protein BWK80_39080 [Desulfobacteraceae bacterium IS3]|nr:MAG: hypothetical protein BWK80_39080 [Desulfobacteraceae bacterium IS3]